MGVADAAIANYTLDDLMTAIRASFDEDVRRLVGFAPTSAEVVAQPLPRFGTILERGARGCGEPERIRFGRHAFRVESTAIVDLRIDDDDLAVEARDPALVGQIGRRAIAV